MLAVTAQVLVKSLNGNDEIDVHVLVEAVEGAERKTDTITLSVPLDGSDVKVNRPDPRTKAERRADKGPDGKEAPFYILTTMRASADLEETIAAAALARAADFGMGTPQRVFVFGL